MATVSARPGSMCGTTGSQTEAGCQLRSKRALKAQVQQIGSVLDALEGTMEEMDIIASSSTLPAISGVCQAGSLMCAGKLHADGTVP